MLLQIILEVINTVGFSIIASDYMLDNQSPKLRCLSIALLLVNVFLSERVESALGVLNAQMAAAQRTVRELLQGLVHRISSILAAPVAALDARLGPHAAVYASYATFTILLVGGAKLRGQNWRQPLWWCCFAWGPVQMTAAMKTETLVATLGYVSIVVAVLGTFIAAAFLDARRHRAVPFSHFLGEVWRAFLLVLPVSPCLLALFSAVLFLGTSVLAKLGLPQAVSTEITRYGTLHAPLITVYYVLKKEWVASRFHLPK